MNSKPNKNPERTKQLTGSTPDVPLIKSVSKLPFKRKRLSQKMRKDMLGKHSYKNC